MFIIQILLPLILLISSGYIIKHYFIQNDDFWHYTEKLNYYFLFPILLFLSLTATKIDLQQAIPVLKALFSCSVLIWGLLYLSKYILKIPASNFGVYMQSNLRFNTYVGLAIIAPMLGEQGSLLFAIIMATFIPFVNIVSVLAFLSKQEFNLRYIIKMIFTNPLILSCIFGLSFNLMEWKLYLPIQDFFKLLANSSLPLGLLCIGAGLGFKGTMTHYPSLIFNSCAKLTLCPALAYLCGLYFNLSFFELSLLVIFCALPCASASYTLTRVLNGNYQLMANIITLQTIFSAVSLTVLLLLLETIK